MNPFEIVYTALWDLLLSHPGFVSDVSVGNRIRYDDGFDRSPVKRSVQAADLPEVALAVETLQANIHQTTTSSNVTRQYKWMIATGDYRYAAFLGRVEWYVFTAMAGWQRTLGKLCWRGKPFVKRANLLSGSAGTTDRDMERGIRGWTAVWRVELDLYFQTSDLVDELIIPTEQES